MNYEDFLEHLAKNGFANMAAKLNPRDWGKLANMVIDRSQSEENLHKLPDGITVLIDDTSANMLHDFGYRGVSSEESEDQKDPRVGDALQVFDDLTHDEQLRVIYGDQSSTELREILEDIIESESVDIEDLLNYIEERK